MGGYQESRKAGKEGGQVWGLGADGNPVTDEGLKRGFLTKAQRHKGAVGPGRRFLEGLRLVSGGGSYRAWAASCLCGFVRKQDSLQATGRWRSILLSQLACPSHGAAINGGLKKDVLGESAQMVVHIAADADVQFGQ